MILITFIAFSTMASDWKPFAGNYQMDGASDCYEEIGILHSPIGDIESIHILFVEGGNVVSTETLTEGDLLLSGGGFSITYQINNQFLGNYISMLELDKKNTMTKKLTLKAKESDGNLVNSLEYSYDYWPAQISRRCTYSRRDS